MNPVKSVMPLAAAMLAFSGPAFGGAGVVTTIVEPLSTAVTYSTNAATTPVRPALVIYVGYKVTIASDPTNTNTINNIVFTGTTSVTDAAEKATFDSAEGASCTTTDAAGTSIRCTIGQLRAGESFPTFAVFFKAPVKDAASPLPNGDSANCAATDCVSFSGTTFYAEGTGGLDNSTPQNSTVNWAAAAVTLGTSNPVLVRSAVPKGGGTFFTGDGAVATSTDTWTTSVVVPSATAFTTAEVAEAINSVACAPDLIDCSTSTLKIPGKFSRLIITLRRDVSTIANGAKIGSARIFYDNPATPDPRITYPYDVLPCTDTTWGPLPQVGVPCVNRRTAYTKKTAPTPDWVGDWEFEIRALDNGKYFN